MRILLVHNFYGSSAPSGENSVYRAERELLRQKGHTVLEFTRHSDSLYRAGFIGKVKGAIGAPWNPFTAYAFGRIARREKPAIIHVHNTFPLISPSIFHALRGLTAAVVVTLHNYRIYCAAGVLMRESAPCRECLDKQSVLPALSHGCYRNSRLATLPVAAMIAVHRTAATWKNHVDALIALTEFQRTTFLNAGMQKASIHVKPHFYPSCQAPLSWDQREKKAVFVGRLYGAKGVWTLVEAWRRWGEEAPRLELIGDGPDRASLLHKIHREGLGAKISLPGQLPFKETQERLAGSRLLILPSLWFEGFPRVICESFALGVPVAASRLGSLPEIVTDGINGVLFAPGNAADLLEKVKGVWEVPEKLEAMGQRAFQEFNQNYTADANYESLMHIYSCAMENRRGRGLKNAKRS